MSRPNTRPETRGRTAARKTRLLHVNPAPAEACTDMTKDDRQSESPGSTASSDIPLKQLEEGREEAEEQCSCGESGRPAWKLVLKLLGCLLVGVVFGLSLEKGRVFEPRSIRGQMLLKRWIMMKMFLSATASSCFVFVLLSVIPQTKERFQSALTCYKGCFNNKGVLSTMLGTFLLGAGMTLSGACPGMVLAQVGAFADNSGFTLLGALVGALVYGMMAPKLIKWTMPKKPYKSQNFWEMWKVPYFALGLPLMILLYVVVILLEVFIPYNDELDVPNSYSDPFTVRAWPPSVAGTLIGLLQLPIMFLATDSLGGSSAYTVVVAQPFVGRCARKHFPYLYSFRCGLGNWWQVFYVIGAILGGLLSSMLSKTHATTSGGSIAMAFCGGFVMLFGSRFGSGCTSGHGLSGFGLMALLSVLAVPTMFAGGISTAFIMWAGVNLNDADYYNL